MVLALSLLLIACAPRGTMTLDPAAAAVGALRTVFVATTRAPDAAAPEGFGAGRQRGAPTFARYRISIPPDREPGEITWPGRRPDARTDFLTTEAAVLADAGAFRRALAAELAGRPRGGREAVIFVHGFNTTYAEGIYRIAQLAHDLDIPAVALHYAWPSAGIPLGYVYDRDSALIARDGLTALIDEAAAAGAERVVLVAHSMGALLTMEALRGMSLSRSPGRDRLAGVVLISPDLDVDLFHAQATAVGRLPQPFVIFTSRRDKALALSARLTGQRDRLGSLADLSEVADLEVTVVDVAAFNVREGHFNVGNSPALLALLARVGDVTRAYDADRAVQAGLLPGAVISVQQATAVILSPITAIAGGGGGRR